jgi:trans-aconitate methyltransferase
MLLYDRLSSWWPLLSLPEDYAEEAEFYAKELLANGTPPATTLLELGSGGGNNASFMKKHFRITLVDLSPGMLEVSEKLNSECEHIAGDMRTVRLGREFDRVFIHDAIVYMTTLTDLRKAVESAYVHCRAGGAALFAPDHLKETFRTGTDHGGGDDGERGLRYLEWTWDPDPTDATYTVDYAYLLREKNGAVRVEHDRHLEGLFSRDEWMQLLSEAGFNPKSLVFNHSDVAPGSYEIFLGLKF